MEALRHLINYFLKIAAFFFLFALVWWVISIFFPALNFRTLVPTFSSGTATSTPKKDLFPSPKAYKGLFTQKSVQTENSNVYVPGPAYNGYGADNSATYTYSSSNYITYTSTGASSADGGKYNEKTGVMEYPLKQSVTSSVPVEQVPATTTPRAVYIRNLSVYQGESVSAGFSFIGEAREGMFKDGKFPIVLFDNQQRVIGISAAVAMTDWTVPGWVRFQTKLTYPVPTGMTCTFLFEEDRLTSEAGRSPARVGLPVRCGK